MMPALKEIKGRIGSVKSTLKITSAMKLVASAKLRKAQQTIEGMRPYERKLQGMLEHLIANNQMGWFEQMIQSMGWKFKKEENIDKVLSDIPCSCSSTKAQALAIQRGRDIVAGKDKLIPHDEVMMEMEQLIENYAD